MASAIDKLRLAKRHLERVQAACWEEPIDWADLSIYGFYALEAAVDAASLHYGAAIEKRHPARAAAAEKLAAKHQLENVADLLVDLNELRKSISYGDIEGPELGAEETADRIESYVNAVANLIESGTSSQP